MLQVVLNYKNVFCADNWTVAALWVRLKVARVMRIKGLRSSPGSNWSKVVEWWRGKDEIFSKV